MFDHVGLKVQHLESSVSFYRRSLKPLGYELVDQGDGYAGFGPAGQAQLWLYQQEGAARTGAHVALQAPNRQAVAEFQREALSSGGRDNGKPGLRSDYGPDYYAAFALDPDGNNIEAVFNR